VSARPAGGQLGYLLGDEAAGGFDGVAIREPSWALLSLLGLMRLLAVHRRSQFRQQPTTTAEPGIPPTLGPGHAEMKKAGATPLPFFYFPDSAPFAGSRPPFRVSRSARFSSAYGPAWPLSRASGSGSGRSGCRVNAALRPSASVYSSAG